MRWSGGPVQLKLSGDIGLTRSVKESNHCWNITLCEVSGGIGLTRSAKDQTTVATAEPMISALVRWTRPTDLKLSGDIGLDRAAKDSNHCGPNTSHEPSGDIVLTRSAKESNHCCTITVTVRTRVVGLCLESVDATALTAVSDMTKAKTILQEGHALQGKMIQKVWRRSGFF